MLFLAAPHLCYSTNPIHHQTARDIMASHKVLVFHLLFYRIFCFVRDLIFATNKRSFSDRREERKERKGRKRKSLSESFTSCVEVNSCADASWSSGNIQHLTNRYTTPRRLCYVCRHKNLMLRKWFFFDILQQWKRIEWTYERRPIECSFYRLLFPLLPWLRLISITFFIDFSCRAEC